ncbi:major facilitator superfamily domain-containing protein 10 isoform X4 [Neomonachus schauinslandi]|uniref:Major facilitator superfamily domain-containing protein 10 isoform X4 n=1 Tax=Neomonachus schauinslandi TaxID=29088 RepID=A0A2Y9G360_NEOSC|nr:major facilitator superfamily domain-containing protein 10 isoform X4 [Neomonachus schauinslandi]
MGWGAGGSCTPRPPIRQQTAQETRVITVVFLGLLLDLLAFTLLLPLLPGLLESHGRAHDPLYGSWQRGVDWFAAAIRMPAEKRYNSVLFGGLIGSVFSFLQFLLAPLTGAVSDCLGRRPVMLLSLAGLATSYAVWAASRSFAAFLASRVIGGISKGNVSLSTAIVADLGSPSARSRGMSSGWPSPWASPWAPCWVPPCPRRRYPGSPCSSLPPTCCLFSASCRRPCPQRSGHPPSPPGSKPLWICSAPWPCSVSRPWPAARTHLLETTWEPSPPGPGVFPLPLPVLGPRVHPELPCPSALPVQQPAAGKDVFLHRPHHGHRAGCLRAEDQPWRGDCSCEAGHPAARARLPPHRLGAHAACAGLGVAAVLLRCRSRGALPVLCGCQLWLAQAEGHDHGHPAEPGRPGQGGGTHGGCLSVLAGGGQGLLHCVLWPLPAPPPAPVESEASSPRTQGRVAEPAPPRAGGEEAWAGDPPSPWAQPRTAQGLQPQRARDTHGPSLGVDGPVGLGAVTPNPSRLSLGFSLSDSVSQASE